MPFVASTPLVARRHASSRHSCTQRRRAATTCSAQEKAASSGLRLLEAPSAFGVLVRGVRASWNAAWRIMMAELAPSSADGKYIRPRNVVRNFAAARNAPQRKLTLYYGVACGWCHRVTLARALLRMENRINLVVLTPGVDGRWLLPDGRQLADVYRKLEPDYKGRFTAPLLVADGVLVSNESADCLRLLHELAESTTSTLMPSDDALCETLQNDVNDGVYRCGFATSQAAYDAAERRLFNALDECERRLQQTTFLCGERLSEADIRLFPTALRIDPIYSGLFGTCRKSIRHDYPAIKRWLRTIHAMPGVKHTCDIAATRRHYYQSLFPLNPGGIVPNTPEVDLDLSHAQAQEPQAREQ